MRINASGLPHSEIPGSKPVCGSPELFAAYHVLHRHLAPRHSPYALSSLTINIENSHRLFEQLLRLSDGVNPSRHCSPPSLADASVGGIQCLWSEKTTVCRIFSCKRASLAYPGEYRPSDSVRWPRGASPRPLWLASLARRVDGSLRSARRNFLFYYRLLRPFKPSRELPPTFSRVALPRTTSRRIEPSARRGLRAPAERKRRWRLQTFSAERGFQGSPRGANAGGICKLNEVENTGLEPVTPWLQTRRSPS